MIKDYVYVWFHFWGAEIDSKSVELILTCLVHLKYNRFNSKLEIVASNSRTVFYTQIYCSTHFYINLSKHKITLPSIKF